MTVAVALLQPGWADWEAGPVLALLRRYDEEGDAFVPRYLDLLAAGGSDAPSALLTRMDLDITDPRFWDGGLALLEELVSEAEALAAA